MVGKPSRSRGLVTRRADGTLYRQDRLFFPRGRVTYRGMPIATTDEQAAEQDSAQTNRAVRADRR